MPNEIDTLMSLDPLSLSEKNIETIVDYLRGSYKTSEKAAKFDRTRDPADKPKLDLEKMGVILPPPPPPLTRRKV